MMTRRRSAVLDTPEQRYASGKSGPRRVAGSLRRDLQEDFGSDFSSNFGEKSFEEGLGSNDFDSDGSGEDSPVRRRVGVRGAARPGILGRVTNALPQTLWGRIAAGATAIAIVGASVAGVMAVRSALLHDARFVVPSSAAIAVEGNRHVTKAQLLSIFGGDVDRNIFTVSLAERRTELERLPWVEHATVMRLLPDHLRVSIIERTPVAFVRQGGHIGLVDKTGVLMDMVSSAGEITGGGAHYSFPVVTGLGANDPLSTRGARMKIFDRFTTELDSDGRKISEGLSEVDLSDPEDVRALIPDEHSEVMVHFGDSDFLDRYDKYKAHLAEWRTQYPRLASVDMRYDRQVVLEMQPGSAIPVAGAAAPGAEAKNEAMRAATAPPKHLISAARPPSKPVSTSAAKAAAAGNDTSLAAKPGHAPAPLAALPASAGAAHHLSLAKDVAAPKKVAVKKPLARRVPAKKIAAKGAAGRKSVAKKAVAEGAAATPHPPPPAAKP